MSKVFILILNYRRYLDTQNCLKSLFKSDLPRGAQIVILDNSPDNKSFNHLSARFPKVKIIKNKKNLGFAAGNNIGIRLALRNKATHVLILNPDTLVPKNFLKLLLQHQRQSKADITAPALEHYQNGQKFFGLEGHLNWSLAKATHLNLPKPPSSQLRPAEFVTFACVLINAAVFHQIGLLNENYFMYLEDVDFCLRARQKNLSIFLDPSIIVKHLTSSSFKKPTDKLLISFKSQLYFTVSWLPWPQKILGLVYHLFFYPYLYFLWTYHSLRRSQNLTKH